MHHVHLAKLLRVTLLAPDLVEVMLDGRLPKGVRLEGLVRPLPSGWAEQRRVLRAGAAGEDRGRPSDDGRGCVRRCGDAPPTS